MFGAAVLTIAVPTVLMLWHRRDPVVRRAVLPVVLSLLVQIGVEATAQALGAAGTIPLVGLNASLWRVRQLRRAWVMVSAARTLSRFLALAAFVFWTINAALLLLMLATGW